MRIRAYLYEDSAKRSHSRVQIDSPPVEPTDGSHATRQAPEKHFTFESEGRSVSVRLGYMLSLYTDSAVAGDKLLSALAEAPLLSRLDEQILGVALGDSGIHGYFFGFDGRATGEPTDEDRSALRQLLDAVAERLPLRRLTFSLHIDSLALTDFRGFETAALQFHGPLTVLFGTNGSGKSTVLDALAIALSPYLRAFVPASNKLRRADELDVRIGADRAAIEAKFQAFVAGQQIVSRVEHAALGGSQPSTAFEPPAGWTALPRDVRPIPLVVQYPTNRAVHDIPMRIRDKHVFVPHAALEGAMSAESKTFRHFFEWFREREDLENESAAVKDYHRDGQLEAVRRAITSALPGFSDLRVRRNPLRMTVRKGPLELRVDQLSDGEKCFLALVGDLARRLATANPWHEDALAAAAIVLIDEIELHLHPAWQRDVVGILRRTFPGCQFIVTTHSPQVLAEVPNGSVVLLDHFSAFSKHAGTYQRDSNAILSEVMGVSERPLAMAERLRSVNKLLDDEKVAEAKAEIDQIAEVLGHDDHEVVGLRTALALIEPSAG